MNAQILTFWRNKLVKQSGFRHYTVRKKIWSGQRGRHRPMPPPQIRHCSIVTFPLSLRVSEILPLSCSSTPLIPTPPLVAPKFPHVPLGVGGWSLGSEERRCCANNPCNSFPRFPIYVILIQQRFRRTDRQTDDMQSQDRYLHNIVHRAVVSNEAVAIQVYC